ncbi:cupin domain-containing protein [Mycolicibacterium sp. lyk4-40-TYG-92]|uniref:cupin domain-containing protein n=1 Tax=Mycolicibacterium sp. lyk4-40-TYG-92 TaxID=3040295 RepID=UPI00254F4FEF|nr:cupin domain-containing protein [Mycolicibacterium sp. lyk4-40-TYG-92]
MTTRYNSANGAIDDLYGDLAAAQLQPLWEMRGLLTTTPCPRTIPFRWRASEMYKLAARSGELIPINEGGDRRVLAMSNPGLDGAPYISNTLWAAVQYLLPGETAPPHRHSPAALRFILDGDGVSTTVDGDSIPMARGDLVLTPAWTWHGHHNFGMSSMMWLDILDLPVVEALEAIFFEPGRSERPPWSRSPSVAEQRYGQGPGLVPSGQHAADNGSAHSPLTVYRWGDTDRGLYALLNLHRSTAATVRYTDPTSGGDVMPTLRCEMTRILPGASSEPARQTGAQVFGVLNGSGHVDVEDQTFSLESGDIFVVPSWSTYLIHADAQLDVFVCSDAPVLQALSLFRQEILEY